MHKGNVGNLTRDFFHLLVLDEVVPAQRKQNPAVERPLKEKWIQATANRFLAVSTE